MKIEADDWGAWTANPITEAVFRLFEAEAAKAKAAWLDASWNSGNINPALLASLKARAEAFEQLRGMSKDQVEESNGTDETDERG